MDQLKQVTAQLAKHQFWIISGLCVILAIVGFYMTSSTLSKLYSDQAAALDKLYSDINTVKAEIPKHPNELSKARMEGIITEVRNDVEAAWRLQYDRQTKLLVWPEAALGNSKKLVEKLKKYSPIETTLKFPEEPAPPLGLNAGEKTTYARYFDDQVPEIVKIIGCEWVGKVDDNASASSAMGGGGMGKGMGGMGPSGEGGGEGMDGGYGGGMAGGMGGMGASNPAMKQSNDLVIWKKASQDELINSIRLWRGTSPTIYEILYTQENMWILEGIMRVIAKTNEGAKANFQASIKEIEFIRIGSTAVGRAGTIDTPSSPSGGGMGGYGGMDAMGMGGGEAGTEGGSAMSGMEGSSAQSSGGGEGTESATGAVVSDPAAGRYVDSTYAPISGDDLRTKMQSEDPQDAYFAVAKRVPVRLRFVMDQRKVPQFLTDCANADLMLEIRQVRIGKTTPAPAGGGAMAGGSSGGYGGYSMQGSGGGKGAPGMGSAGGMDTGGGGEGGYGGYGMDGGMGGGMGGMMGGGMGGMMGMGAGAISAKPSWEMPVEVYGVIYLYNPVSIKRLGLDKVTENTELTDKVETPATNPEITQPQAPAPAENSNVDPNATAPNPGNAGTAPAGTPAVPGPAGTPAPAASTPGPATGTGPAAGPGAPVNPSGTQPAVNP